MSIIKSMKVSVSALISLLLLLSCSPQATEATDTAATDFKLGEHYEIVREQASSKPTIVEHFSLYCIHCFHSETLFKELKGNLATDVSFNRSHVLFLPQSKPEWAKNMTFAFETAKQLGIEDEFVAKVFDYQFNDKVYLGEINDIRNVFVVLGKSGQEFDKTIVTNEVRDGVRAMAKQAQEDKVRFTPDLIVNNKYRVLLGSLKEDDARGKRLTSLVNYLLTNP